MPRPGRPAVEAKPGFFQVRRSARHPWIAVKIEIIEGQFVLWRDGTQHAETWPVQSILDLFGAEILEDRNAFGHPLLSVWLFGQPISEETYRYRVALGEWARTHAPDHPAANPTRPIDPLTVPIDHII